MWNEELAVMAQQWADKCVWKHGNPEHNPQPFSYIGQNIHATTGEWQNFERSKSMTPNILLSEQRILL